MSDEFKVPPGGTFDVTLKREGREEKPAPPPRPEQRPGLVGGDESESRYVFRASGGVTLYDLGLRLRSRPGPLVTGYELERAYRPNGETGTVARRDDYWNEYVPVETEALSQMVAVHDRDTPVVRADVSDMALMEQRMLGLDGGLDPFGESEANVTGRKVPNSAPLPYRYPSGLARLSLDDDSYDVGHNAATEVDSEPHWRRRKPAERDATERWNPYNAESGVAYEEGRLSVRGGGELSRVAFRPVPFVGLSGARDLPVYHYFDTGRPDFYKVTSEPDYESPAVEFRAVKSKPLRVYLAPVIYSYTVIPLVTSSAGHNYGVFVWPDIFGLHLADDDWAFLQFGGRIPTYPHWPDGGPTSRLYGQYIARTSAVWTTPFSSFYPSVLAAFEDALLRGTGESLASGAVIDTVGINVGWIDQLSFSIRSVYGRFFYPLVGRLAAVIAQGKKRWYVWANSEWVADNVAAGMFEGGLITPHYSTIGPSSQDTADVTPSGLFT